MTDQERDTLLLELRDRLERIEATQAEHGEKLDAIDARVSDVARAVRELGGDVADDPPVEVTG